MATDKLEISPARADCIKKAQETCNSVRDAVIADTTIVLEQEQADATAVAQGYVRNRLKKHILNELAGSGSTTQPYTVTKTAMQEVIGRLKSWASAMFPAEAVQKLQPEILFEQVWDEVIEELQTSDDADEVGVEYIQHLPKIQYEERCQT